MWFGRFERIEDSVAGLANLIGSSHAVPRLVRVEGIDGVGKSRLSRSLKTELSGEHLEVDEGFRRDAERFESFVEAVQVESFRKAAHWTCFTLAVGLLPTLFVSTRFCRRHSLAEASAFTS
jgi:hypothetical protein